MAGEVRLSRRNDEAVLFAVIDTPGAHNALSPAMMHGLAESMTSPPAGVSAIVLRGAGTSFCSGTDSRLVREALSEGWSRSFQELVASTHRLLVALLTCPVPVIAAVDGMAVGVGSTVALLADTRVVSDRARVKPGHFMVGSPLDGGSSYALTCAFGPAIAMSLLLDEDGLSADDLHRFGLAGKPVACDSFDKETARFAGRVAGMESSAIAASRSLLRRGLNFDEQWDAEVACLRSFVESGRLARGVGQYWAGQK